MAAASIAVVPEVTLEESTTFATVASATEMPYLTAWDHLQDERRRLNLRLALAARRLRRPLRDGAFDALEGVGETESLGQFDRLIAARLADPRSRADLPLARLTRLFQLTAFEAQCLIVCV